MLFLGLAMAATAIKSVETLHMGPGDGFDVRVTYPVGKGPFPVVVWSHGLGGSKDAYQPLATYWAEHGYIVIQPTHADSLAKSGARSRQAMLASTKNWSERPKQISAVIDGLPVLGAQVPDLKEKVDLQRVVVGGHSFGAHTSQLVAGTELSGFLARGGSLEDKRPIAFIWISPQGTGPMLRSTAWANIHRPILMISGDNDASPIDGRSASWRREVWDGLAPGDKYLLWVKDAYHGFGGISGRMRFPGSGEPNEGQVQDVQMATTTFLDAFAKNDPAAKKKLTGANLSFPAPATLSRK